MGSASAAQLVGNSTLPSWSEGDEPKSGCARGQGDKDEDIENQRKGKASAHAHNASPKYWRQFYLRRWTLQEIIHFMKGRESRAAVGRRFGTLDTMETERYFEAGVVAKAV